VTKKNDWGRHGFHYHDAGGALKQQDALLHDETGLNNGATDSAQIYETTAVAIAGNQKDSYYGSVEWGWRTDGGGAFMKRIALLFVILAVACTAAADNKKAAHMTEQTLSDLETRLVAAGYDGLFLSGDRSGADAIWMQGKNQPVLQSLVLDGKTPLQAKFLAAELLRDRGGNHPRMPRRASPRRMRRRSRARAIPQATPGD
jgi:hypothetical protein